MSRLDELIQKLCPNGVEYRKLGELGKFFGGITGKSKDDFTDGNAKFITYKNVYDNPSLQIDVEERVKIADGEKQRTLQYGDVIFTGSSETPDECGMSSVVTVKTEENLYLNSFCFFFRFDDMNIMLPDFAKHLFRSNELRYQIGKTANGVTRYNISKKMMEKVSIPVPPLEVQRKIVRILDSFTLLTAELTAELTARKKQYEYYRNHLLTYDASVKVQTLGEVCNISAGGDAPKEVMTKEMTEKFSIPIISNGIGENALYGYTNIAKINTPAVTIAARGTIGYAEYRDYPYFPIIRLLSAIPKDTSVVDTKYLYYCLKGKQYSVPMGGIPQLTAPKLKNVKIPVPNIEEQQSIVDILDRFDSLCNDITTGLPAEIEARQKQYEFYRDKLLSFKQL